MFDVWQISKQGTKRAMTSVQELPLFEALSNTQISKAASKCTMGAGNGTSGASHPLITWELTSDHIRENLMTVICRTYSAMNLAFYRERRTCCFGECPETGHISS